MTQGFVWGKQNKKRNYGRNWHQNISEEKNKNKIWKNTAQIYLKKTNKKTTNTWQSKVKTNPTIFLKKKNKKRNDGLKSFEVDIVNNFIKDENFSDLNTLLMMLMILKMIVSLHLDKIHVASTKTYVLWNGAPWRTKNSLKTILFFLVWMEHGQSISKIWWRWYQEKRDSLIQKFSTDVNEVSIYKIEISEEFSLARRVENILLTTKVMEMLHLFCLVIKNEQVSNKFQWWQINLFIDQTWKNYWRNKMK